MAIQQALQTCGAKTARGISHGCEQRWRQWRQGYAPAGVISWRVHHAAIEVLATLNTCTHRVFSCLSPRLSFLGEKDNRQCAKSDAFACKISPVFLSVHAASPDRGRPDPTPSPEYLAPCPPLRLLQKSRPRYWPRPCLIFVNSTARPSLSNTAAMR